MKTVRDDTGREYLLLTESDSASLVRDPETGTECYIQNDRLEPIDESALELAAQTVSDPVRTLLRSVHDDRTLGLLVELDEHDSLAVRTILSSYDFCESDLHGRLAVLTAAGLIAETEIGGERGYRPTKMCKQALGAIRSVDTD